MRSFKLGIVADDYTGASDAASMLTERGVRTLLCIGVPGKKELPAGYEAIVIGLPTRSVHPRRAYREVFRAAKFLDKLHVRKIQVKYCSTFDSTKKGNIGPSLDAATKALSVKGTIVCPALPVNGRTTCMGHHFVGGALLSESPLRHHPLNPMIDSNLVRWLQHQTRRKVGLLPLPVIRQGRGAVRARIRACLASGERYWVADALEQSDIAIVARATQDHLLISGGSGITAEIPGLLFGKRPPLSFKGKLAGIDKRVLVIAGSCSPATRAQNAFAMAKGWSGIKIDGVDILRKSAMPARFAEKALASLAMGCGTVVYSSASPEEVKKSQALGGKMGLTAEATGLRISEFLAEVCAEVMANVPSLRLVLSGGETTGSVIRKLGWKALEIGLPVNPGVPYGFPSGMPGMLIALKSGNFGDRDFYLNVGKL
jgi:uncharacterized protein YgbK (DUF1537 family)